MSFSFERHLARINEEIAEAVDRELWFCLFDGYEVEEVAVVTRLDDEHLDKKEIYYDPFGEISDSSPGYQIDFTQTRLLGVVKPYEIIRRMGA